MFAPLFDVPNEVLHDEANEPIAHRCCSVYTKPCESLPQDLVSISVSLMV